MRLGHALRIILIHLLRLKVEVINNSMKKINYFFVVLYFISNITMANDIKSNEFYPWSIIGSLGYDWYQATYNGYISNTYNVQPTISDGQSAFGRFAIAKGIYFYKDLYFGIETGIQSGNTFRLNIQESDLMSIGGMLPQATIKPELDLLATVFFRPENSLVFGGIKFGPAWRRMQINDRVTFNDLSQIGIEIQAGGGILISPKASLSLNYQLISNGRTNYIINNNNQGIGTITNIPKQNGLLLGITYSIS